MGPPSAWIASLIERCLSLYGSGRAAELDVEDDGSNLRFSIRSGHPTLINDWPGSDRPNCNVTDWKTQIEAIVSHQSLRTYEKAFPDKPIDRNIRGYTMEIEEFQVVFVYTIAEPSVHLYVEKFSIAWDKPKFKGPPQGRKLKRHPSTASLMKKVFEAINAQRSAADKTSPEHREDSPEPQLNGASQMYATQNLLVSQVQAPATPATETGPVTPHTHNGTSAPNQLLGHLGSRTKPRQNARALGQTFPAGNQDPDKHTGHIQDRTPPQRLSSHDLNNSASKDKIDVVPEGHQLAVTPASSAVDQNNRVYQTPSPRHVNKELGETSEQSPSAESATKSVEKLRHHALPANSLPVNEGAPKHHNEIPEDPWEGMSKIRKLDVVIPPNQVKLLEQHVRHWVPPPPGQQMPQGCVPPELLSQWNSAILQINEQPSQIKEPSPVLVQNQSHPESVDPGNGSKDDSESEGDSEADKEGSIPWSSSPMSRGHGRRELPEDSSPIKPSPVKQKAVSRKTKVSTFHAERPPKEPHVGATSNVKNVNGPDQSSVSEESAVGKPKPDINDTTHELDHTAQTDTTQGRPHDNGEESDESMMDTSVPCPLGRSSQAYHASQSDQEVSSSGPPLPETQERVQVMETPAANFKRIRSVVPTETHDEQRHEQISPPGGKSSSQSRIVNTYASNNSEARGTQHSLSGSQTGDGANNIDVIATQVSNGSWSMHDGTSLPYSSSILHSSAPNVGKQSPQPHSSSESAPSSKPFSSHNELMSSIEEEDKEQVMDDLRNSAHSLPSSNARASPLKRPATDFDIDGISLAKRLQISRVQSERTSRRGSTFSTVSRRESYLNQKDDRAEAHGIFKKFQDDYPSYSGDFGHFCELCYKLRALREQDALKRSFLWDDFIIKNLEDFQSYLEDCGSKETKAVPYEQFFLSNYNRPSYKKRSLTADGIEKAASQHVSYPSESPVTERSLGRDEPNTSFTGSLVARFSNFHAHSFGPIIRGSSDDNVDQISVVVSSPIKDKAEVQPPTREDTPVSDPLFIPMSPTIVTPVDPVTQDDPFHDGPSLDDPSEGKPSEGKPSADIVMAETQSQGESQVETNEDADMMDTTHEVASVELGSDHSPRAASPTSSTKEEVEKPESEHHDEAEEEVEEEEEDDNEHWFDSLRHIREPGPGWWDDPNTPLKTWAQADQNVLSERVHRPGWARMPVDEKGVIQPWWHRSN